MIRTQEMNRLESELGITIVAAPANVQEPRQVGMTYYNGSFGSKLETVLAIELEPCHCKTAKHRKACQGPALISITVQDAEGIRTHCTSFNHKWSGLIVAAKVAA